MKRITCPYLGLKDDPTTLLNFPSPGNYCHQANPIAPVKGTYQEKYCLTEEHTACPLYQATHPVPLPAEVSAAAAPLFNSRQVVAILGIPVMLVAAAAIVYAWPTINSTLFSPARIPNTGPVTGLVMDTGPIDDSADAPLAGTRTAFSPLPAKTATPAPTAVCPLPANWVTYSVSPTDSLFRLSLIYGVSVEDLQKNNCMGSKTAIVPGQVIYVPFIPTNTPISTNTLAPAAPRVVVPAANTPTPSPTSTNPPAASSTPVQATGTATAVPSPTDTVLPTAALPTATPVPPTPTIQPSGTPVPPTPTSQPTNTALPTNTPLPTSTNPPPATATNPPPPPTATATPPPPAPTATNPPPPTATNPPPATATNIPPAPATATNPPPPTATNPPPATATNPPPPPAATNPPPTATP